MHKSIAIIGGGAAGMMAAARISELAPEVQVVLFEKNPELGRKVIISGGGRCNLTTGIQDVRELLTRYMRGNPFLTSAMWNFPPAAVYAWFEEYSVPLKTEEDLRVFPESNNGRDIVRVFKNIFVERNVDIRLKTGVTKVEKKEHIFLVESNSQKEEFDAVIITTGGQAYRHTGSTGDGYSFAENLGHTVTELGASLNAFILQKNWMRKIPGVSFTDVTMKIEGKRYSARGPVVCTHKGLSGPAVFALSAQVAFEKYSQDSPLKMSIDWMPNIGEEELRLAIQNDCDTDARRLVVRILQDWVPRSMAFELMKNAKIDQDLLLASFNKDMRKSIVSQLKNTVVEIIGRSAGSEFVTAGGVDTDEIHPSTMESKITPGLFFGGEIMNVDGVTGGFNLQASWATGRLAGESVVESKGNKSIHQIIV